MSADYDAARGDDRWPDGGNAELMAAHTDNAREWEEVGNIRAAQANRDARWQLWEGQKNELIRCQRRGDTDGSQRRGRLGH